ncbi:MAG TPA: hypothetical protein VHK88_10905 [Aquihabitans sp.]|nr:hypothetical protein [Aquihabitans sp.]
MEVHPGASSPALARDRRTVLASIYRHRGPSTARAIADRTGLSTLVVIPALEDLVAEGLVSRRAWDPDERSRPVWSYQLTPQGRRTYQSQL